MFLIILSITEIVRIFDGNTSQKKKNYRTVAVPKTADVSVLLVSIYLHIVDLCSRHEIREFLGSGESCENLKTDLIFGGGGGSFQTSHCIF